LFVLPVTGWSIPSAVDERRPRHLLNVACGMGHIKRQLADGLSIGRSVLVLPHPDEIDKHVGSQRVVVDCSQVERLKARFQQLVGRRVVPKSKALTRRSMRVLGGSMAAASASASQKVMGKCCGCNIVRFEGITNRHVQSRPAWAGQPPRPGCRR
jgi:hypothetical protein